MAGDDETIENSPELTTLGPVGPHGALRAPISHPSPNHPPILMMMKFSLGPPYVSPVHPLVIPPVLCLVVGLCLISGLLMDAARLQSRSGVTG